MNRIKETGVVIMRDRDVVKYLKMHCGVNVAYYTAHTKLSVHQQSVRLLIWALDPTILEVTAVHLAIPAIAHTLAPMMAVIMCVRSLSITIPSIRSLLIPV